MGKDTVKKVRIHLRPYTAICIYKFLSEFESDFENDPMLVSFKKCYEEYSNEVLGGMTREQMDDAVMETRLNQILERDPPSKEFLRDKKK